MHLFCSNKDNTIPTDIDHQSFVYSYKLVSPQTSSINFIVVYIQFLFIIVYELHNVYDIDSTRSLMVSTLFDILEHSLKDVISIFINYLIYDHYFIQLVVMLLFTALFQSKIKYV